MEFQRLTKILEAQVVESRQNSQEVGIQREQNHRNYTLQPLGNERAGRSRYISPDVLDSVEAKKAIFTETFFSGRQVVKFAPDGYTSPQEAEVKTAYAMAQLRRNRYFQLFRDGWHDAFVAKRMVLMAQWKEDSERVTIELDGTPAEAAMGLLQNAIQHENVLEVDDSQVQPMQTPQGVAVSGSITAVVDRAGVEVLLVQPERFYRDPKASYVDDAAYCVLDMDVSRGRLVEMGYDPAQVIELRQDYRFKSSTEDAARKAHDQSSTEFRRTNRPREQELVTIYKTFAWLDADTVREGSSVDPRQSVTGIDLYEIHWSGGQILKWANGEPAIKVVEEMPFFEWTEYKIAHAENGMSDADVLSHTQRVNSILKRLILDNQQMRNTTRYQALYGAVKNPRDLMDNKIGGVVWTNRQDAVKPLDTPELSPLIMPVLQMLKSDAESRSGVTDLAKGMNTDAIRYQNAADMIDRLTNAGNRRVMKAARDFAETLLIPLVKHIVKLGKRHDKRMHVLQISGYPVPVQPQQWRDQESECRVQVALTAQAGQQAAQSLLMLHQLISQDQQLSQLYQLPQRHALIDEVFDALGHTDSTRFLMRPDDPRFMQQAQQQAQQQQMMMQMQMQAMQLDMQKKSKEAQWAEADAASKMEKARLEERRFQLEAADKAADNMRQDKQFEWERLTNVAELSLENDQQRAVKIGEFNIKREPQ